MIYYSIFENTIGDFNELLTLSQPASIITFHYRQKIVLLSSAATTESALKELPLQGRVYRQKEGLRRPQNLKTASKWPAQYPRVS